MVTTEELLKQVEALNEAGEYDKVIELLPNNILEEHKNSSLYSVVANAYSGQHRYEDAIIAYKKALEINPDDSISCHGLGMAYFFLKNYNDAIKSFEDAIKINNQSPLPYGGLGLTYYNLKEYDKAINSYKKAIELSDDNPAIYNGLGIVYLGTKRNNEAIDAFTTAIERNDSDVDSYYYNRSIGFYRTKRYADALKDLEHYLELSKNNSDAYTRHAEQQIEEIKNILKNVDYKNIIELVNKIKELLSHKDGFVTHYTSFSIAQKLILEKKNFRLSEGSFLNDTAEGRELFKYLNFDATITRNLKDTEAKPFAEKPFIGSFVSEIKHDYLTLWRMYGKENKEEAKGCAITIDGEGFVNGIKAIKSVNNISSIKELDDDLKFYHVAYRTDDDIFVVPGSKDIEKQLNSYMKELINEVNTFKKNVNDLLDKEIFIREVLELLNSIAYLFKSAEYQYEHELRLVVKKAIGFDKYIEHNIDSFRVYIELLGITPYVRKITLGPKVERREEWAAIFYYTLEKDGHKPDIYISHLPFK